MNPIALIILILITGACLGSGITLATIRRRNTRIERETWNAARIFYSRINP